MRLIRFIEQETSQSFAQILFIAAISGVANSILLGIVNHASEAVADGEDLRQYLILYMLSFGLFLYAQWFAFEQASTTIENAIHSVRTRLGRKLQQVGLPFVELAGNNRLYARFTQSDTLISQLVPQITGAAQMSVLLLFSFLYLAYISPISFVISLVGIVLGLLLFLWQARIIRNLLQQLKSREKNYFRLVSQLINGFKEIKLNRDRSSDLLGDIGSQSDEIRQIKIRAARQEARIWGVGRVLVYSLLPILIFVLPTFNDTQSEHIYKITATMLFITGPVAILLNIMPLLSRVNIAIEDLCELEREIDAAISGEGEGDAVDFSGFASLTMKGIQFRWPGVDETFSIGPLDETFKAGEIVFVVGGNGSGKSTCLKLLAGLYEPDDGELFVDDVRIDVANYPSYRKFFSGIFTDFHLFDRFYGIAEINEKTVNQWIKRMQLQHKVQFEDSRFNTTRLSTGQRKRLALIAALLEERPVLLLDEFAADQDPQFRQYFYETLLPDLKGMGKTVIAVSHDDQYFAVADRLVHMQDGRIVRQQKNGSVR